VRYEEIRQLEAQIPDPPPNGWAVVRERSHQKMRRRKQQTGDSLFVRAGDAVLLVPVWLLARRLLG
jgi:hypothetical protein